MSPAILFGLATSLGFGAMQLNTGLNVLVDMPVSKWSQVGIIGAITCVAVLSVISGLDRGLKWLSVFNLGLALLMLVFVLVLDPTLFIIRFLLDATGGYLTQLIELSLSTDPMGGHEWQKSWTIFYWMWWIARSPFVGIFIARISHGWTIREFRAASPSREHLAPGGRRGCARKPVDGFRCGRAASVGDSGVCLYQPAPGTEARIPC
ncbi:BCCT family transporter [Salicola sp. Rm-C-2C1-2]|uniref:BCCT family transporter n=1 Tax=Salicola sp. Rm-C-2C1-2 TaxID=3141321 RepID=UPI0032E4B870